jgi:hypothetical protein
MLQRRWTASALLGAALGLAACSGMNATEQRVLSGGAIGAGAGAALTGLTGGNMLGGAILGGAAGAAGGYLYDQHRQNGR